MTQKLNLILLTLSTLLSVVLAKDVTMKCAACHLVVEEFEWQISQTDPKKKLEVGSFRIHPDGTQKSTQIIYRRSETQLHEILEDVCVKSREFIQINDTRTDPPKAIYVRQNPRDGKLGYRKNVVISSEIPKKLKFACEMIIEDYEDDLLELFKEEKKENLKDFCVQTTELCSENDLYDVNIVLPHELKPIEPESETEEQSESESGGSNESAGSSESSNESEDESESASSEVKDEL